MKLFHISDLHIGLKLYNRDLSEAEQRVAEVIIAKQRNGPIGTVNLVWLPQYTRFANMEK